MFHTRTTPFACTVATSPSTNSMIETIGDLRDTQTVRQTAQRAAASRQARGREGLPAVMAHNRPHGRAFEADELKCGGVVQLRPSAAIECVSV